MPYKKGFNSKKHFIKNKKLAKESKSAALSKEVNTGKLNMHHKCSKIKKTLPSKSILKMPQHETVNSRMSINKFDEFRVEVKMHDNLTIFQISLYSIFSITSKIKSIFMSLHHIHINHGLHSKDLNFKHTVQQKASAFGILHTELSGLCSVCEATRSK